MEEEEMMMYACMTVIILMVVVMIVMQKGDSFSGFGNVWSTVERSFNAIKPP